MKLWYTVPVAVLVAVLMLGCGADLGSQARTVSNPYTGGSIPPGEGPVRAVGYVVDAMNNRAPIEGSSVSISSTGAPGTVLTTTTDEDGFFYVDEIEHGYVTITASGPGTYATVSCVVNATTASVVTCSIATYAVTPIPLLPPDGGLGGSITDMPESIPAGATIYPGELVADGQYADYLTFACASDRIVVNRDGSITALEEGTFELIGAYKTKRPKKVATVDADA